MTNERVKCYDYENKQWHHVSTIKFDIFTNVRNRYDLCVLLMRNADCRQEHIASGYVTNL